MVINGNPYLKDRATAASRYVQNVVDFNCPLVKAFTRGHSGADRHRCASAGRRARLCDSR